MVIITLKSPLQLRDSDGLASQLFSTPLVISEDSSPQSIVPFIVEKWQWIGEILR